MSTPERDLIRDAYHEGVAVITGQHDYHAAIIANLIELRKQISTLEQRVAKLEGKGRRRAR